MLGVVPLRKVAVDAQQLECNQMQAAALEPRDHLTDETSLHPIRFDQDEGSLEAHGAQV